MKYLIIKSKTLKSNLSLTTMNVQKLQKKCKIQRWRKRKWKVLLMFFSNWSSLSKTCKLDIRVRWLSSKRTLKPIKGTISLLWTSWNSSISKSWTLSNQLFCSFTEKTKTWVTFRRNFINYKTKNNRTNKIMRPPRITINKISSSRRYKKNCKRKTKLLESIKLLSRDWKPNLIKKCDKLIFWYISLIINKITNSSCKDDKYLKDMPQFW